MRSSGCVIEMVVLLRRDSIHSFTLVNIHLHRHTLNMVATVKEAYQISVTGTHTFTGTATITKVITCTIPPHLSNPTVTSTSTSICATTFTFISPST